jgi:N6-L-threonylcarbamoyladenine synthase
MKQKMNRKVKQGTDQEMKQKELIRIVGIETSCDETSVAVVENGRTILSNIVSSQMDVHKRFGGVVPEVASRRHVEDITLVLEEALHEAKATLGDIDAIAVTKGPGLVGALLIGVAAAKAISFAHQIPLLGVHHIAGHIYANRLVEEIQFPCLTLVVSGGHTELVLMQEHGSYEILGETRDDAVGEAFDKVARSLQLPYPGGPHIDRLAAQGEETIPFPRSWLEADSYDFSFSGLKSAVLNYLHNAEQREERVVIENVAASFQASVIEVLVTKTIKAAQNTQVRQVLLAGGVAANQGLRSKLTAACQEIDLPLLIPPFALCTDNAAMIASAGFIEWQKGNRESMALNAYPSLELK